MQAGAAAIGRFWSGRYDRYISGTAVNVFVASVYTDEAMAERESGSYDWYADDFYGDAVEKPYGSYNSSR